MKEKKVKLPVTCGGVRPVETDAEGNGPLSMEDEDRAFFISAYKTDPRAREDLDAAMKETGVSYEEFFGLDGKDKKTGPHGEEK